MVGGAQEPGETAASEAASVRRQGPCPVFSSPLPVCPALSVCLLPLCSFPVFLTHAGAGHSSLEEHRAGQFGTGHEHVPFPPVALAFPTLPWVLLTRPHPLSAELTSGCGGGDLFSNCEWCRGGQRWGWALGPAPGLHVQGELRRLANPVSFVPGASGVTLISKLRHLAQEPPWLPRG